MIQIFTQKTSGIWIAVACTEQQVITTTFADIEQNALNGVLKNLPLNIPFQILSTPHTCAKDTFTLMADMLEGKDVTYSTCLATDKLPKYTVRVLKAVMQIPTGYIATYGAIAKAVGGGPRAVGNVMAGNLFVPIVPCHRVVKGDFSLGGYGGGLKIKYQLLTKEKRGYSEPKDVVVNDAGLLRVYPVEVTLNAFMFQTF